MRQLRKLSIVFAVTLLAIAGLAYTSSVSATPKTSGQTAQQQQGYNALPDPAASPSQTDCDKDAKCESIFTKYLIPAINLLSAAVGIIVVAMIIYGGIEFSSSGGDPQRVASAKNHITNAIIALVAFLFLWAFLNFIMPGGVLNGV